PPDFVGSIGTPSAAAHVEGASQFRAVTAFDRLACTTAARQFAVRNRTNGASMNGTDTSFLKLAAERLKNERFTLVDVGCSGGLEPAWRVFGDRLRAIGFDASASECRRLAAEETNPDVHYVEASSIFRRIIPSPSGTG